MNGSYRYGCEDVRDAERVNTYIADFLHVIPNKLLTPDETLNTRERNQKRFTAELRVEPVVMENWSVVAVTLEKKVAIAVILS